MAAAKIVWNKGLKGTPGGRHLKGHNRQKRNCLVCGIAFEYYGCEKVRKYCSLPCRHIGMRSLMKGANTGNKNGRWRGRFKVICVACGKLFQVGNVRKDIAKFCSQKCGSIIHIGEGNNNWKGGVTDADRTERQKFRELMQSTILARDNYTCQICGQYGGYLQVDHIKGWADYPQLRFVENNCRTLCMACHYYVTFKKKLPAGVIWGHNFSRRVS